MSTLKSYKTTLNELEDLMELVFKISNSIAGISGVTFQQEQGSYIFIKIGLTIESILKNLPYCVRNKSDIQFWDISSISILTRSLLESYLVLYYLCIDEVDEDTALLKELIWEYHADKERLKMLEIVGSKRPEVSYIKKDISIRWEKIEKNASYNKLTDSKIKEIRKGSTFKIIKDEDIIKYSGVSIKYYKVSYKWLSGYVHTNGVSIQQIIASTHDKDGLLNACKTLIQYCINFTYITIRDITKLFPNLKNKIPDYIFDNIKITEKFIKIFPNQFNEAKSSH